MPSVVLAGQTSVGLWLLSCTFVFQLAAVPGGRFSNPPTSQSPGRWLPFPLLGENFELQKLANEWTKIENINRITTITNQ